MLSWLVLLALLFPLFWLIRVLIVTRVLLGHEFRAHQVLPLPPEEIPAHLREAAQPWLAQLEPLGFRLLGAFRFRLSADPELDEFAVVLTHHIEPIRALLTPHPVAARSGECWLALRTTIASGFEIVTASYSPEALAPRPPGIVFEALATENVAELLQRHRARIVESVATAWMCVDLHGAATREQYLCDGVFAHVQASGLVAPRGDGVASYRLGPALVRSAQLLREAKQQQKAERKAAAGRKPPTLSAEAQTAFDLAHYRQMVAMSRTRLSLRTKTIISVVSFLAFAAVLAWQMSPVVAIALIVALVIHECGHLVGMWWFGLRDTQLLFIPFLGGAAVGHDDKVLQPWQHIVIILLGPLPGLFAGLALLMYHFHGDSAEWLQQAALTAVALNAFNLLPILPLDGGQIVDYGFASRFPRVRVLFLAASALGLLGVALVLDAGKLLLGLAVLMLLRLPIEWRLARVRRELRGEFPAGADEDTIVRRLLARFRQADWSKVTAANRLALARSLQQVLRMPRPGFGTMCFAVAGYTSPIWVGVPVALWAAHRSGETLVQRAEENVRAAGLRSPRPPPAASAPVPPSENGALLYAEAEALLARADGSRDTASHDDRIIELLRAAARKSSFVPADSAPAENGPNRVNFLTKHGQGSLVLQLTTAARERLRYREPDAAMALAIDALRLIRLLDTAPDRWSWSSRRTALDACWEVFEELFAAGAGLQPERLAELRGLVDEPHEIRVAARTLPLEVLQSARVMDDYVSRHDPGLWVRAWLLLGRIASASAETEAETMNQAVALHRYLQEVERGNWPKFTENMDSPGRALTSLAQLGDQLARVRQARVALGIVERRLRGLPAKSFEALEAKPAELQHPFTREPMRWTRRGSLEVLAFAACTERMLGSTDPDDDLVWRLPPD